MPIKSFTKTITKIAIVSKIAVLVFTLIGLLALNFAARMAAQIIQSQPTIISVYNQTIKKDNIIRPGDLIEIKGRNLYGSNGQAKVLISRKIDDQKDWSRNYQQTRLSVKTEHGSSILVTVPKIDGQTQASIRVLAQGRFKTINKSSYFYVRMQNPTILRGKIALQARKDYSNIFDLRIRLHQQKELFFQDYVSTNGSGEFEVELLGVEPKLYDLNIKAWHYLSRVVFNVALLEEGLVEWGELTVGDTDNNDMIDSRDVELIDSFMGQTVMPPLEIPPPSEPSIAWHGDVDGNGVINGEDIGWLFLNLGLAGAGSVRLVLDNLDPVREYLNYGVRTGECLKLNWQTLFDPTVTTYPAYVKLEYLIYDTSTWMSLREDIINSGEYLWCIALQPSTVQLRVNGQDEDSFYYIIADKSNYYVNILSEQEEITYPKAQNVLVVYNTVYSDHDSYADAQEGKAIAEYYLTKRHGAYKLGLAITDSLRKGDYGEIINRKNYEIYIRNPIKQWLDNNQDKDIRYIVLTKGLPLKIEGNEISRSSVDSELALLDSDYVQEYDPLTAEYKDILNPYYHYNFSQDVWAKGQLSYLFKPKYYYNNKVRLSYLVTRLDGYSVEDIKSMIDRALSPDKVGRSDWILDDCCYPDCCMAGSADRMFRQNYDSAKEDLEKLDVPVTYENTRTPVYEDQDAPIMGYVGYGAHSGFPDDYISNNFKFNLANGALFSSYESFNAVGFHDKDQSQHGQLGEWIAIGGSGGVGNVWEPFGTTIANEAIWMSAYQVGYPLADAFYLSLPYLSWSQVVVGDPLTNINPDIIEPQPINNPPIADAGEDQIIFSLEEFHLDGSDSYDPDGDEISYHWVVSDVCVNYLVLSREKDIAQPIITAPIVLYPLDCTIYLTVSDGEDVSEKDKVKITIKPLPFSFSKGILSLSLPVGLSQISIPIEVPDGSIMENIAAPIAEQLIFISTFNPQIYGSCDKLPCLEQELCYAPIPSNCRSDKELTVLDYHKGYLVMMAQEAIWQIKGKLPSQFTIPLRTGYNLVPFLSEYPKPLDEALKSIEGQYLSVSGGEGVYDLGADSPLRTLYDLRPLNSYWIQVTDEVLLKY